jgi:hypothetical protein
MHPREFRCGYQNAHDLETPRDNIGFSRALGKLPGSGAELASESTTSQPVNATTTPNWRA